MAHKYDKKTPREHVLIRPDTYIGHIEPTKEHMWVFQKNKITKKEIKYVPGLYKLFDEIIVNSRDHHVNDKTCNLIDITVDEEFFSVMNNGNDGIPVEEHPEHKTLVPTMIFGEMLTSSNYDDTEKRTTGGRNGLGSKCTNIFSTKFEVEVIDNKNKKHFQQTWEDNMSVANKPSIKKSTKKGMCKVTSYPDFKRFKIKNLKNHIPLFHKRAYDLALTTKGKVKVKFNGEEIKIKNLQQYMDLYFPDCDKIIDNTNDRASVGCIYIPDIGYENISFVNGISTFRGGTHCNYICDMIIKSLINDHIKKKNKEVKVSMPLVKENLVFFIDSVIDNPSFISQTKEALTTKADKFGFKYEINKSFMTKLSKSGIVQQIVSLAKFKENTALKKTDGKKTTTIKGIPKLEDANKAGTKKSNECSLFLTEGDSAKSMVMSGLSQKDRDFYGVFPLKGKLLNVREASIKQIGGNDEINNLKKIIGLKNEYSYEDDKEFETLRYGKIVCLCDQDVDGFHIKGLIINMFHTFWPKLLERKGFITYMNTPIVKATKGKEVISFYNLSSYEQWKEENDKKNIKGWYIKYYKGLGTSDSKEAKEYFVDIKGSLIGYDGSDVKTSKANIELAFSKELADRRKKWLMDYDKDNILDSEARTVSVSDFVNKELIHFSNEDNMRSIPSLVDGFKPSQRKILFGAFLRGLEKDQIKVAQLAGFVSDRSAYHHGEASLMGAIIGMAQNFVGSNNINILEPKGQFGSRINGGRDHASPRYIFTKIEKATSLIFRKEDNNILSYVNDDGQQVEPEYYLPIIPMLLVNGATGIGTGFSTNIPCYHPYDIINNIKAMLNEEKPKKIHPYYNKFKGTIKKLDASSYQVKGCYTVDKKNDTVEITELPVGEWTNNYKMFLEKMLDSDANFMNYTNNNTDQDIYMKLKFKKLPTKLDDKLKMNKKINITNLHAYSASGAIKKFTKIQQILDEYYIVRLDGYQRRKDYLLKVYKHIFDIIKFKVKFIKEIVNKTLKINNKKKAVIEKDLTDKEYPKLGKTFDDKTISYDYLLGMNLYSLTKEKIEELEKQLDDKKTLYNTLKKKSPQDIWKEELEELEDFLQKNFKFT